MWGNAAAALLAAVFVLWAPAAGAAQLTSIATSESATLPKVRPNWPVPRDPNQVFYLQRSTNKNTVVYTARFDASGGLNTDRPAQAYWRRYQAEGGIAKPLKGIERRLAYGVRARPHSQPGAFTVTLAALPELPMLLRPTAPGQAELLANIGGRTVRAAYVYVEIDESGLIPKVTEFTLFGIDTGTGRALSETFRVTGGLARQ